MYLISVEDKNIHISFVFHEVLLNTSPVGKFIEMEGIICKRGVSLSSLSLARASKIFSRIYRMLFIESNGSL